MRRRWLPLWLVVCVLISQTALARHVVLHTVAALTGAVSGDLTDLPAPPDRDRGTVCEQCLALIAVDAALPTLPFFAPLRDASPWRYPPPVPMRICSVPPGPTHIRDPPRRPVAPV